MSLVTVSASQLTSVVKSIAPQLCVVDTAWTDGSRGVQGGELLSVGNNITDQQLKRKNGGIAPTIRSQNHDEILGVTSAHKIVCDANGLTLDKVLKDIMKYIAYKGYKSFEMKPVDKVVARFQHALVPLDARADANEMVAPRNLSYQTTMEGDPRNFVLLVTSTGIYAHTDGVGPTMLFAHTVDDTGKVHDNWFEVEEGECAPGASQEGNKRARDDSNKATVCALGVKGSVPTAGRMLVISIPLEQKRKPLMRGLGSPSSLHWGDRIYRSLGSAPQVGECHAACLNVGDANGETAMSELELKQGDGAITVTQMDYSTLKAEAGPTTISEQDALRAAASIMHAYAQCDVQCKLSELPAMLHKMENEDWKQIKDTLATVDAKKQRVDLSDPWVPTANALALV